MTGTDALMAYLNEDRIVKLSKYHTGMSPRVVTVVAAGLVMKCSRTIAQSHIRDLLASGDIVQHGITVSGDKSEPIYASAEAVSRAEAFGVVDSRTKARA